MSIGLLWLGLHGIGFAMIQNGSNYRGNPAWDILMRLFHIEVMAFWLLVFIATLIACGIMGPIVLTAIFKKPEAFEKKYPPLKEEKTSVQLPKSCHERRAESPAPVAKAVISSPEAAPMLPLEAATKSGEISTPSAIERPRSKEKTAEELKEKAIAQFLRGF